MNEEQSKLFLKVVMDTLELPMTDEEKAQSIILVVEIIQGFESVKKK